MRFWVLLVTLLALAAPAAADYVVRDGNGTVITIKSQPAGGAQVPQSVPSDPTGAPYSPANPPPLSANAAQEGGGNLASLVAQIGALSTVACPTDTSPCDLNSRVQRLLQHLSSLIAALGAPVQTGNASLVATAAGIGSPADAQYGGSGTGTLVAIEKLIASTLVAIQNAGIQAGASVSPGPAPSEMLVTGCRYVSTAPVSTPGQSVSVNCDERGSLFVNGQVRRASYRFAALNVVPAANGTDVVVVTGSASKIVRLTQLKICGVADSATTVDVLLIMRTAADTGGTSSAVPMVPLDPGLDPAATATVASYTANPTLGSTTGGGTIDTMKLNLSPAAGCLFWEFGTRNAKAPVLRDAVHQFAVNWNAQAVPTNTKLDITGEGTEE